MGQSVTISGKDGDFGGYLAAPASGGAPALSSSRKSSASMT